MEKKNKTKKKFVTSRGTGDARCALFASTAEIATAAGVSGYTIRKTKKNKFKMKISKKTQKNYF